MLGFSPLASAPLGDDGAVVVLAQQENASLVSSSSLAALAQTVASGSLALSGVGSASFVGNVVKLAATNLAAIGSASFDSDLNAKGQVSIEAIGSISAQGGGVKVFALASLSSVGSTLLVGERILFGATQLSSSYALSSLGELKYGGRFKPIVGEFPRWTESGDTRVTEDGDTRLTGNVEQNVGIGSVVVSSTKIDFNAVVYANRSDEWKVVLPYIKYENIWQEPAKVYRHMNDGWKRIY